MVSTAEEPEERACMCMHMCPCTCTRLYGHVFPRLGLQVWAAEVNFFHADRRCGVVVYLQPPEVISPEAVSDAEAPDAPAPARVVEAVRRPAPSVRLSEEPGGCSGPRIGSGPDRPRIGSGPGVERLDADTAAAGSEAGGSGVLATQRPSASMMAMSFRKAPLTLPLPLPLTLTLTLTRP